MLNVERMLDEVVWQPCNRRMQIVQHGEIVLAGQVVRCIELADGSRLLDAESVAAALNRLDDDDEGFPP